MSDLDELKDRITVLENKIQGIAAANIAMAEIIKDYRLNLTNPLGVQIPAESNASKPAYVKQAGHMKWFVYDSSDEHITTFKTLTQLKERYGCKLHRVEEGKYKILEG